MSALLEIDALELGPIGTNCYVVRATGSARTVVIDPGGDVDRLLAHLEQHALDVEEILVTHCHWDHIGGVAELAAATGAPVWMSGVEAPALETPEEFTFPGVPPVAAWPVEHRLDGTERFEVAGLTFDTLLVPGHSPGHLAFVVDGVRDASGDGYDTAPVCFIGDLIFRGSIGRTDLPFADEQAMRRSLRQVTERLHADTVLLSGHGPATVLRREIESNPFLQGL
ncbi:MAG: beta-lactamase domain protein [Thermoleophilia bacterium]|nr:beta-lactamase domain protein [Thermoleophilia bacterium]